MTYHVQHVKFTNNNTDPDPDTYDAKPPTPTDPRATWLAAEEVEGANVGTGVKKVWAQVYGAWGKFEVEMEGKGVGKGVKSLKGDKIAGGNGKGKGKRKVVKEEKTDSGKVVKKIMMPLMPKRAT